MKKITIIDGQGGKIGKSIVEHLKKTHPEQELYAIGTNALATSAMLKAGADYGATGENPCIVNAADSDIIIGPIGIVMANALLGEITPAIVKPLSKVPQLQAESSADSANGDLEEHQHQELASGPH